MSLSVKCGFIILFVWQVSCLRWAIAVNKLVFLNCDSDFIRQELDMSTSEEISADDADEYLDFTPNYCCSIFPDGHSFKNYKTSVKNRFWPKPVIKLPFILSFYDFKMRYHKGGGFLKL